MLTLVDAPSDRPERQTPHLTHSRVFYVDSDIEITHGYTPAHGPLYRIGVQYDWYPEVGWQVTMVEMTGRRRTKNGFHATQGVSRREWALGRPGQERTLTDDLPTEVRTLVLDYLTEVLDPLMVPSTQARQAADAVAEGRKR